MGIKVGAYLLHLLFYKILAMGSILDLFNKESKYNFLIHS